MSTCKWQIRYSVKQIIILLNTIRHFFVFKRILTVANNRPGWSEKAVNFKSLCPKLKWLMLVPTNLRPWYPLAYRAESKFLWSCSYFTQVLFQISSRSAVLLWVFWVVCSPFPFLMSRHVMLIGVWAVEKKLKISTNLPADIFYQRK